MKAGAYMHLRNRDTHTKVTPRWGGIGMWLAMAITFLIVSHLPLVAKSFGREATGIFLAGTFIMILGALDDLYDLDLVRNLDKKGIIIFNVSQCSGGEVIHGQYETSKKLEEIGVVSGGNITTEAAITKLMLLLGRYDSHQNVKKNLTIPLNGEMD